MRKIGSLLLSLVSLGISIMMILILIIKTNKISVVTLDTYLAASLSLVGLFVVFVLAYQIFNTVDLKEQFEKLKIDIDREIKKLEVQSDKLTCLTKASRASSDGGIYINSKDDFKGVNSFIEAVMWYLKLYETEKCKEYFSEIIINVQNSFECIADIANNIYDNNGVFLRNGENLNFERIERRISKEKELNSKIIESVNYNMIKYLYDEVQQLINKVFICVQAREKPNEDLLDSVKKIRNNLRSIRKNENC